ncbi:FG-GAP repeat protein [Streptomyces sp. NBC_01361]|uniref:FG-GAP repeat protein n=1 Tax=Streptomyces sp. NBC_01361 TaxID=2903838 RepID=UPI002E353094|nr:FG-GAP repeat protein [Streptomyces sp. NBC_01361]
MRKRTLFLATALTTGLLTLPATSASAAPSGLPGDFNGDGYRDIALTAGTATVSGTYMAGRAAVVYGSSAGLNTAKRTVLSQASTGIPGTPETEDTFGDSLATGDLNGDGYADLVVGAPNEKTGTDTHAGAVTIVWGSASGLSGGTTVTDPRPTKHDYFGATLAVGDFDGDGHDDLAVGSTGSTVDIIRGGFTKSGTYSGTSTVTTALDPNATSGSLAAGDTNRDGVDDLVVQGYAPYGEGADDQYAATYLFLQPVTAPSAITLPGAYAAAVGDLNKDGYGDVVLGNPLDKTSDPGGALGGKVTVLPGSATGPALTAQKSYTQATAGVPGTAEAMDRFGTSLSVGDANADGYGDLAIGSPGEAIGSATDAGTVVLLRGSAAGLTVTGAQAYSQSTSGVPGASEKNDSFGSGVLLSDINKNGRADLTTGAAFENGGTGAVWNLRGSSTGLTTSGATSFSPSALGFDGDQAMFGNHISG